MNDFSEIENELRKLRPAQPSPILFDRIEEALAEPCRASTSDVRSDWWRFTEMPYKWGLGLAAAAALVSAAVEPRPSVHVVRQICS